jgi:hypothetical protein
MSGHSKVDERTVAAVAKLTAPPMNRPPAVRRRPMVTLEAVMREPQFTGGRELRGQETLVRW